MTSIDEIEAQAAQLEQQDRFAEAEVLWRALIARNGPQPTLRLRAALCAIRAGTSDQALAEAYGAIADLGSPQDLFRHLANVLRVAERMGEVLETLELACELAPDDVDTLVALGRVRHFHRDYGGGTECYLRAHALAPTNQDAVEGLIRIHFAQDLPDQAVYWQQVAGRIASPKDYGPLVGPDQTSDLSDQEYAQALYCLGQAAAMIDSRGALPDGHPGKPGGQWSGDNSCLIHYRHLATGDREIVARLRLYCQQFSGFKLPTLERAWGRKPILAKMPSNWGEVLEIIDPRPEPAILESVLRVPDSLRLLQPCKFGEIGWAGPGGINNTEAYCAMIYVLELAANGCLERLQAPPATKVVLEIGGGFGNLARCITSLCPDTHTVIVDIPESLAFSSIYLSVLFPDRPHRFVDMGGTAEGLDRPGFTFISSAAFRPGLLGSARVDLAINTMSLAEMSDRHRCLYGAGVAALLADDGEFFEQNPPIAGGYDYVGSFMRPYYEICDKAPPIPMPVIHAGRLCLWRKPRHDQAMRDFAAISEAPNR
jgi:tetratricopeptide (TPR) repeat protein